MKTISRIFLLVMAFLFVAQVVTGGLGLQKRGSSVGYYSSVEDWTEESSEDDVEEESDDDLDTCEGALLHFDLLSQSIGTHFTLFCLQEHILEIIPPPPQV